MRPSRISSPLEAARSPLKQRCPRHCRRGTLPRHPGTNPGRGGAARSGEIDPLALLPSDLDAYPELVGLLRGVVGTGLDKTGKNIAWSVPVDSVSQSVWAAAILLRGKPPVDPRPVSATPLVVLCTRGSPLRSGAHILRAVAASVNRGEAERINQVLSTAIADVHTQAGIVRASSAGGSPRSPCPSPRISTTPVTSRGTSPSWLRSVLIDASSWPRGSPPSRSTVGRRWIGPWARLRERSPAVEHDRARVFLALEQGRYADALLLLGEHALRSGRARLRETMWRGEAARTFRDPAASLQEVSAAPSGDKAIKNLVDRWMELKSVDQGQGARTCRRAFAEVVFPAERLKTDELTPPTRFWLKAPRLPRCAFRRAA